MTRPTREQISADLDQIAALVQRHPDGIGRVALGEAYHAAYGRHIEPRTLLRRLGELAARGRVKPEKGGPAATYRAITPDEVPPEAGADEVPMTARGRAAQALVTRPITQRQPVGYDQELLFSYRPEKTWYLPVGMRRRLHELGRTPDDTRPADTFARDILGRLLIDLSWASSRLEGNTYSRLDTRNLLEFGLQAEGKDAQEAQMILNHKAAIEYLVDTADAPQFPPMLLRVLHGALSENLLKDPADVGRVRERAVEITGTRYTPTAIPQIVRACHDRIIETVSAIPDPLEQAFFLMVHVPYLQPFVDINKRTSRVAANWPLLHANLSPLSFVDVPERAYIQGTLAVYEARNVDLLRDVFAWAYERSCAQYRVVRESVHQPDPLRLRYRAHLREVLRETVRAGEAPTASLVRAAAAASGVGADDLEAFAKIAMTEMLNLDDASALRYQLRPAEVMAWRARFRSEASAPRVGGSPPPLQTVGALERAETNE